ncbi:MAG: hypothetical protein AB1705_21640 [Verrucomicrobiota bacterium]
MRLLSLLAALLFVSPGADGHPRRDGLVANFNLRRSSCAWQAGFADYPAGQERFYELAWQGSHHRQMLRGLFLSGSNHSDDLFMYIKRPLGGLKPLTRYEVGGAVQFLSKAPTGCVGIGGDPGASVFVKFGASTHEPCGVIEDGMVRLNVDIGHQSNDGANALVIGDIATSSTNCHNECYELKELETTTPLLVRTDECGALWIFVGTDSGFEGKTSVIYTRVHVRVRPES